MRGALFLFLLFAWSAAKAAPLVGLAAEPVQEQVRVSLFEAGLFVGGGYLADYPGANQNHLRFLPVPYFLYRGTVLRADEREGVRVRMALAERVLLEASFAGSFPVHSTDNTARQGMPDLDWLGEVGPRLAFLFTDPKAPARLRLLVPFRAVFSTNLENIHHRGFSLSPGWMLDSFNVIRPHWRGLALLSSTFADRELSAYFYDVVPEFARTDRPIYDARAGYLGSDLTLALTIPFDGRFRFFTGTQFSYRDGSANTVSPLFKSRHGYGIFIGIAYTLFQSSRSGSI